MAVSLKQVLAHDLSVWWGRLPASQKVNLAVVALIASVAIPLSVAASKTAVKFTPRAASGAPQETAQPIENAGLTVPQVTTKQVACKVNQPCSASIQAIDRDAHDLLTLTIDFLPDGLGLSQCTQTNTLLGGVQQTCSLEGTATDPGNYLLSAMVTDDAGNQDSRIVKLILN